MIADNSFPIRFKPFVGKNYNKQDFKILVLGESHYLGENDLKAFHKNDESVALITNHVVNGYLNYKQTGKGYSKWMNTFTKFTNALNQKKASIKEIVEFWNASSFYNYVQAPTKGPRQSPSEREFILSLDAFKKLTSDLKPDIILFWGNRLWNNFPKENYYKGQKHNQTIHYIKFEQDIPIMILPHPSSTKFNKSTYEKIENYITTIKNYG